MGRKRIEKKHRGVGGRKKHFAPLMYRSFEDYKAKVIEPIRTSDCFNSPEVAEIAYYFVLDCFSEYENDDKKWRQFQRDCYNMSNNYRKLNGFPMKRMIRTEDPRPVELSVSVRVDG